MAILEKPYPVPFEVDALIVAVAAPTILRRGLAGEPGIGFGPLWEQMAIARSLVAGQGFANPFGFPTGPTAVCAPVHPAILAVILRLFGDGPASLPAALLLETATQVVCLLLLVRISAAVFHSWEPGAWAAALMVLYARPVPQWENSAAWLAAEAITLSVILTTSWFWSGIILGLGWLVSPALLFLSLWLPFFLRGWKYTAKAVTIAALVLAPWLARNWLVFHSLFLVRDGFGLELFISNNDLVSSVDRNERYTQLHPTHNSAVDAELVRLGEPQYFHHLQEQAIVWISAHRYEFLRLTGSRFRSWWASTWLLAAIHILGLLGWWLNRASGIAKITAAAWLLFPLPYYLVQFDPRYGYPVLWLSALLAGFALWRLRLRTRT